MSKSIMITGAGSGMGRLAAIELARRGHDVIATVERPDQVGELSSAQKIAEASRIALGEGADFLKTSTGKVSVNATLPAARIMLEEIARSGRPVGVKPAGGIRDGSTALAYLMLAEEILGPGWVTPQTFRIGASGLLDTLMENEQAGAGRY